MLRMFLLVSCFSGVYGDTKEETVPYSKAYKIAVEEKKPLVVLVGADWCAACKLMKENTIAPIKSTEDFKEIVFTSIDKDKEPDLAKEIMTGSTLPQIIVFCETEEGWHKLHLTGNQSQSKVIELIRKAKEKIKNFVR